MTADTPIRRATAQDAPACAAIVATWLAETVWMPDGPSRKDLERMMREGFPVREAWVAGDPVAGYLSFDPDSAHIRGFYVARPGHGTGKVLMDHVKTGRDRLSLNSHMPNHAAHRFYAREGFRIVEEDIPGPDGVPELRMEWSR
ncbi:MAG: GNAT family N-acetyltransferase [Jannaschia sp.]